MNKCAFAIDSGTINLTLKGENTLKSGQNRAGLQVESGKTLIITDESTGNLTAAGGIYGAGIGGGYIGTGGNISGGGGNITIDGGTVIATGDTGAGIGGGSNSAGGTITISSGTVTATGKTGGAGIGGGGIIGGGTGGGKNGDNQCNNQQSKLPRCYGCNYNFHNQQNRCHRTNDLYRRHSNL